MFEFLCDCVDLALFQVVGQWNCLGYGLNNLFGPLLEGAGVSGDSLIRDTCRRGIGWGSDWKLKYSYTGDTMWMLCVVAERDNVGLLTSYVGIVTWTVSAGSLGRISNWFSRCSLLSLVSS